MRGAALVIGAVLALALPRPAHAQRMLETVSLPERADPIKIAADYIATWEQGGHQILLLRGNVNVNQGETTILTPTGVVWVDLDGYDRSNVFRVVVYGENGIGLTHKTSAQADYGYVKLATTNSQISIRAKLSQVQQKDLSSDQGYRRALANQTQDLGLPKLDVKTAVTPIAPRVEAPRSPVVKPLQDEGIRQVGFETPQGPPGSGVMPATATYFQGPTAPPGPGQPPPPVFTPNPPPPPPLNAPKTPSPRVSIRPRTREAPDIQFKPVENNMTAVIVTGAVTLFVKAPSTNPNAPSTLDIEADRVVIWTPGNGRQLFSGMSSPDGVDDGAHEIYMSGNVEIRSRTKNEIETLRADEIYFDVRRNVAVARQADLEIMQSKLPYPIHLTGQEILRENEKFYRIASPSAFSSILPSDPGLKLNLTSMTVEERQVQRKGIFGLFPAYDEKGQPKVETERIFTGRNIVAELEGVPFFYFPYLRGRVEDPLGPLDNVQVSYNRILGVQIYTTWDMFDLLNINRPSGDRWRLYLDYLSQRGPAGGMEYEFSGRELFGTKAKYEGNFKIYGGQDVSPDILGGDRGNQMFWPDANHASPISHSEWRGWVNAKANVQDLPNGFSFLGQLNLISDRNYLEQYYLNTWLNDLNQDTYLYLKQQQDIWAWSIMGQFVANDWLTQTDWLPKVDGYLLGRTFFDDLLVYNAHANVGYARLRPPAVVPFAYFPTDVRGDTARVDLWQDVSLPFYLGPLKLAPYLAADLAYYSQSVNDNPQGRAWGAGGLRWNLPLSKLYPDIQSTLFNVDGIYHKINLTGNYQYARINAGLNNFPQLDRVNDNASDQALRDIRPLQTQLNPANAAFLTSSGLFNPQTYLIRRLIDSNADTYDDMHVLQFGIRQRWQTQRGFPGAEHVVDWMTLNVQASVFPQGSRDNFGQTWGILEYDWTWNIGDRNALTSAGWFEPFEGGPREFEFGATHQRPDGTNFYLGYRQLDPLNSKAVVAAVTVPLSAKYAVTASTTWDFGTDVRSYSLLASRMGTDVMINAGINFNSTVNTIGVVFEVLPNLARRQGRAAAMFPMAPVNLDAPENLK